MDKIENLKKLKELLDNGVISSNEFSKMKSEILSDKDDGVELSQVQSTKGDSNKINESTGTLTVRFDGQWFIFDVKTQLFVDNKLHSTHSTKRGFNAVIPITSDRLLIKVVLMSMKSTEFELEELDKSKDYTLILKYDTAWGKYSNKFQIVENG